MANSKISTKYSPGGEKSLSLIVRVLQALIVLMLISVGVVLVLYEGQWLEGTTEIEQNSEISIVEKFIRAGNLSEKNGQKTLSPLVREAKAFALYLNPPQPPKLKETPNPESSSKQTISAVRQARSKPKFRLVATSCYRSKPEKSMALISEPDSGFRWVKQGSYVGHFLVEKIKRGMIIYQDGDQLCEMAIDTKVPIRTTQLKHTMLASSQRRASPAKPSIPRRTRTTTPKLLHKLGLQRPEARPAAYARERRRGDR